VNTNERRRSRDYDLPSAPTAPPRTAVKNKNKPKRRQPQAIAVAVPVERDDYEEEYNDNSGYNTEYTSRSEEEDEVIEAAHFDYLSGEESEASVAI